LITKHFIDYDNFFLRDFSHSKSAVCSAPVVNAHYSAYSVNEK